MNFLRRPDRRIFRSVAPVLAGLIVLATYSLSVSTVDSESANGPAAHAYYNRLIDGFEHGQLSLAQAIPPSLASASNPYDARAFPQIRGGMFQTGRVHDLSYFDHKLYLYFSVIPAIVLFLPYHWLTGAYLSSQAACGIFCGVGFLAATALLLSLRRSFFPTVGPFVFASCLLGLGIGSLVPMVLCRPDVWEVPITCAYAFGMLSFLCLWNVLRHDSEQWRAVLALSLCTGLAAGSRPSAYFIIGVLIFPLLRAVRLFRDTAPGAKKRCLAVVAATLFPIGAIGGGLLLYNYNRFGDIFEFGQRYQLSSDQTAYADNFSSRFVGFNFHHYFLHAWEWDKNFPFVSEPSTTDAPAGHGGVAHAVGLIPAVPFVLLAGALPVLLVQLYSSGRQTLLLLISSMLTVAAANLCFLCFFFGVCLRYQMEFAPLLVLLAVIAVFDLRQRFHDRPRFNLLFGAAWGGLLTVSVIFNILASLELRGNYEAFEGLQLAVAGNTPEAIMHFQRAAALRPADALRHRSLGLLYSREGKFELACKEYQTAANIAPVPVEQQVQLGFCLYKLGRLAEARHELESALAIDPDSAPAAALLREIQDGNAGKN